MANFKPVIQSGSAKVKPVGLKSVGSGFKNYFFDLKILFFKFYFLEIVPER